MPIKQSVSDKKLKGTHKSRVHDEYSLDYIEPRCPDWLSEEAREIWDRKAPSLVRIRVLSALNEDEFAEYCNLVVELRKINKFIAESNQSLIQVNEKYDPRGGDVREQLAESAYSKMRRAYQGNLDKYAKMFKLRPSDMKGLYNFDDEEEGGGVLLT